MKLKLAESGFLRYIVFDQRRTLISGEIRFTGDSAKWRQAVTRLKNLRSVMLILRVACPNKIHTGF